MVTLSPRYQSYNKAEMVWLDSLPIGWELAPIKYQYAVVGGSTPNSGEETYWDGDIVWVTPADLSKLSTKYVNISIRSITLDGLGSCGATLVPKNSVIVSTRAPIGSLAIAASSLCTNQGCKALVPISKTADSRFLYYWLLVNSKSLNMLGKGTTFLEISGDVLASFKMPIPSYVEQETIANFLDYETAKIDTLIDKQQQLIKLLKEKRQAVISHAVTKGLNPDAPMKDSGVEWLGEVPEHWLFPKISHIGRVANGSTPDKSNLSFWSDGSIPWLASSCLNSEVVKEPTELITQQAYESSSVDIIPSGSILVGMVGQGKTRGSSAILGFDSCINQNMAAITIDGEKISARYLYCLFQAMYEDLRELGRGGNQGLFAVSSG